MTLRRPPEGSAGSSSALFDAVKGGIVFIFYPSGVLELITKATRLLGLHIRNMPWRGRRWFAGWRHCDACGTAFNDVTSLGSCVGKTREFVALCSDCDSYVRPDGSTQAVPEEELRARHAARKSS